MLTLAILRFRLMPLPALLANQEWAKRLHRMDTGVPYGIALALAALLDLSRYALDEIARHVAAHFCTLA